MIIMINNWKLSLAGNPKYNRTGLLPGFSNGRTSCNRPLSCKRNILMKFIIKRDVTAGGSGKCISVNGNLPIVQFKIPTAPQL